MVWPKGSSSAVCQCAAALEALRSVQQQQQQRCAFLCVAQPGWCAHAAAAPVPVLYLAC